MTSPVLIVPEVSGYGGIQMVCRHLAAAFDRAGGRTLSLNDTDWRVSVGDREVRIEGFERNRVAFIRGARRSAENASVLLFAHPHLAAIAPLLRGRPMGVLGHGKESWVRLSGLRRLGLRRATAVGAVSRHTLERMVVAQGLSPRATFVLNPAIDPSIDPGETRIGSDRIRILSVARLARSDRYKGIDRVLMALPSLVADFPELEYVVVGDGDDRARLERIATVLHVDRNVTFAGSVSDERLRELYSTASAFVLPSVGEGYGIVYLEAMSYGVPIIGAAGGAAPEALADGECGLLVDPNNKEELREAIVTLLTNEPRRAELITRGLERVKDDFSYARFEERVLEVIELIGSA